MRKTKKPVDLRVSDRIVKESRDGVKKQRDIIEEHRNDLGLEIRHLEKCERQLKHLIDCRNSYGKK